ncbi:polysaccharide lyase 8 family protein [Streptomyces sp. NRRL B-24720]|uniref:polysaccharide lyase 8 family protein n=1 Tax=Streptomyces sp. NRRL B-24720 TaxID=1476876 RepID=UPI0004C5C0CC|nr:polysaccharide lyase 8 family protein [Streptomyces sp. NRRL B-24720]
MPSPWARRTFLHLSGGAAAAVALSATAPVVLLAPGAQAAGQAEQADEFDALRAKWVEIQLGSGIDASVEPFTSKLAALGTTAAGYRSAMSPADGSLWPDLPFSQGNNLATNYTRLVKMAQAYLQPGTKLTGDASLAADIIIGAEHLYTRVFNPSKALFGNSWHFTIGIPLDLSDLCVLMYDELSQEQIAKYSAAINHFIPPSDIPKYATGANLTDQCRALAVRGIAVKDAELLSLARDFLSPLFPLVTTGDGLYADGSFVQHLWVPYTGSYGGVMISGLARLLGLLGGTSWAVTDPGVRNILDGIDRAFAPVIYNGQVLDAVNGRAVSRQAPAGYQGRGYGIMNSILLMAQGGTPKESDRWRAMVKGWLRRDAAHPFTENPTLDLVTLARFKELYEDDSVEALPEPVGHHLFASMDRAVHRRKGWTAALSLYSSRIQPYECLNGEHLHGWHTGSGFLQWYADDGRNDQYAEAFWPTVDPYRLPGTTVTAKRLADGAAGGWGTGRSDRTWVGGTTDGEFAAVGQDLKGVDSTLTAKKSWFFLDDAIVCLGAGITAADGQVAETIVENRKLGTAGTYALTVDGRRQPLEQGWTGTFNGARWAHIEGHGGYVFPGGTTSLHALREERTGAWKDINTGQPDTRYTHPYLTLRAAHGSDPADATYAYVVLPRARSWETAARAKDKHWLQILANTADRQGVHVRELRLTAVNFWQPGTLAKLTTSAPAGVLIREHRDGTATLCVSDPTQLGTSLDLVWHRPVRKVLAKPDTVTAATTGRSFSLSLDVTGAAGAPQQITVQLVLQRFLP